MKLVRSEWDRKCWQWMAKIVRTISSTLTSQIPEIKGIFIKQNENCLMNENELQMSRRISSIFLCRRNREQLTRALQKYLFPLMQKKVQVEINLNEWFRFSRS